MKSICLSLLALLAVALPCRAQDAAHAVPVVRITTVDGVMPTCEHLDAPAGLPDGVYVVREGEKARLLHLQGKR